METSNQSIVDSAIDGCVSVTVSIEPDSPESSVSAHFQRRESEEFTFETDSLPEAFNADAIQSGLRATFQFGISSAAVRFEADVISIESQGQPAIVRCAAPSEIAVIQRRGNFRAPVASDCRLDLLVWKVPPHWVLRDRPKPSMQLRVELVDLSVGGMCLNVLANRTGPDSVSIGDRLRAEFTHNNEMAVLDAEIVYQTPTKEDGSMRIGVAFRKLENTIEGRRAISLLDRVIASLHAPNHQTSHRRPRLMQVWKPYQLKKLRMYMRSFLILEAQANQARRFRLLKIPTPERQTSPTLAGSGTMPAIGPGRRHSPPVVPR